MRAKNHESARDPRRPSVESLRAKYERLLKPVVVRRAKMSRDAEAGTERVAARKASAA